MALNIPELHAILDQLTPTKPITVDDTVAVCELIRPYVAGNRLDVMFTKSDGAIHVKVYSPQGLLVFERDLTAV
jgi:hypothetical protein